ncbi:major facilitator superfamily domain-containing protein 4A-like [Lingula anatina]|uniref:Major facilitator superfamily domain-containing protein 4A-like n=1 Tax=Lingula anatina TaxID=7574 RepID=A0A1S3JSL8_LINAN|nr:major facilitator superfamily domain-containing protein 4A-like [Lingula anatina]|eukprot:XP_013413365.1 major facilitator superfamily domain-containing protein 4A-like [Lingula anatina]
MLSGIRVCRPLLLIAQGQQFSMNRGLAESASKLSFQLWGREAAAPVFATSLAFGLGAIVGPQIIEPFLGTHSHVLEPQNNNVTSTSLSLANNSSLTHESGATAYKFAGESLYAYNQTNSNTFLNVSGSYLVKRIIPNNDSQIEYAYTIGGIMSVLAAIAFLVLQYVSNRCKWNVYGDHTAIPAEPTDKKPTDSGSALQSGKCAKGDTVFGVQLLGLMLFFYIHIVGGEWALDKFMFAYITEGPLHREPFEASLMVSIFWGCYTGGRGISALISKWVKPSFILGTVVLGQLLAGILLCTEAGNNVSVFWFVNCLYGLAIGPVYPGALVWVNRYIQVSGMVLAVVLIGGSAGGFIYQWIVGIVFQLYGLDSLGYVMLVEGICITTTFVLLEITGRRHGTRFKKTPGNNNDHGRKGDDPEDVHVSMLMLSQV